MRPLPIEVQRRQSGLRKARSSALGDQTLDLLELVGVRLQLQPAIDITLRSFEIAEFEVRVAAVVVGLPVLLVDIERRSAVDDRQPKIAVSDKTRAKVAQRSGPVMVRGGEL